jgi:hypothetical protein
MILFSISKAITKKEPFLGFPINEWKVFKSVVSFSYTKLLQSQRQIESIKA